MRKPLLVTGSEYLPRACACASASAPACLPTHDAAARLGSTHANLMVRESLRCPPSRRVPHKWSGRRPDKTTGRAAAFPLRNAEDCLSSEGGHRRLCSATSEPRRPAPRRPSPEGSAPRRPSTEGSTPPRPSTEGSAPPRPRPPRRELIAATKAGETRGSPQPRFHREPIPFLLPSQTPVPRPCPEFPQCMPILRPPS